MNTQSDLSTSASIVLVASAVEKASPFLSSIRRRVVANDVVMWLIDWATTGEFPVRELPSTMDQILSVPESVLADALKMAHTARAEATNIPRKDVAAATINFVVTSTAKDICILAGKHEVLATVLDVQQQIIEYMNENGLGTDDPFPLGGIQTLWPELLMQRTLSPNNSTRTRLEQIERLLLEVELKCGQDAVGKLGAAIGQLKKNVLDANTRHGVILNAADKNREACNKLESSIKSAHNEFSETLERSKDATTRIEGLLESKVAGASGTQAIKFWEDRKDAHGKAFDKWRWAFVGVVALSSILLVVAFCSIPKEANEAARYIGVTLAIGALVAFVLRTITRVMISHLHLADDASERVVMMESYIRLGEIGKVSERDRSLMLNALFRASQSGLIKDESATPGLVDLAKIAATKGDL